MAVLYTNNAASNLSASITNTATSFSVTSGQGALFPAITGSDYFYVTLLDNSGNIEIVKVTARSIDTFTVTRAQDGTAARAWSANDKVELRITKAMLDDFKTDTRAGYLPLSGGTITGSIIAANNNVGGVFGNLEIGYGGRYNTLQTKTNADTLWLQYSHSGPVGIANGGGLTTVYGALNINSATKISGSGVTNPTTADSTDNSILSLRATNALVRLQFGTRNTGNYAGWIQASYDNTGGNNGTEPIDLNPLGGAVYANGYTVLHSGNYTNYTGAYVLKAGDTMSGKLGWGTSMPNNKKIIGIYETGNLWTGIGMAATTASPVIAGDGTVNNLLDVGYYSQDGAFTWNSKAQINKDGIVAVGSRNISLNTSSGWIYANGDSGGWAMGHGFYGSGGTFRGGFGALGGGDGLTYFFVGADYNNVSMTWSYTDINAVKPITLGGRVNASTFGGNTSGMSGHAFPAEVRASGAKPTLTWHYEGVATRHIALDADGALNVYNPGESGGAVFKVGGNTVLHASNFPNYLADWSYGNYRFIADYGSNSTWNIRGDGHFVWGRAHDWTQAFSLNLGNGTSASNDGWAELGQRTSNNPAGTWFGTRFVQYTGSAKVDGYVRAGRYYVGGDSYYMGLGDWGMRHTTPYGWIQFGPANNSWAHIYASQAFYFNQELYVNNSQVLHGGNYTNFFRYNVWNDWLRDNNDDQQFKIYGNNRTVIFRTDGNTNDHGGGGYAYIWYYGGSDDSQRRMILNTDGTIWSSNYGWLHTAFASSSHNHDGRYLLLRGTNSGNIDSDWGESSITFDPVPSGTPPVSSPNIRTLNLGNDYNRRTQLAFNYDSDRAFFRRRTEGGWGSWREFLHSGNWSDYAAAASHTHAYLPLSGGVVTGPTSFRSNPGSGVYSASANNPPLQAYSDDTGSAYMSFHRGGYYAVNFGLDPDNVLRIGGWSASSNRWQLDMSGNTTIPGRATEYAWTTTGRNYSYEWIELPNYSGLYSANNGAHFYPNNGTYGSWRVAGSRNSWSGLEFDASNGQVVLMIGTDSNTSGFHNNSYGWQFRWNSGTAYVYKNAYGGGTAATVLDSSNYTNYTLPIGGSWYGTNLPGSRYLGIAYNGGEFVLGNGLPNANQMGVLIDGCYVAGENNGFWSMGADNTWGSRRGMYWDGTYLRFDYGSPVSKMYALTVGNWDFYENAGGWNANIIAAGIYHGRVRVKASSYNSSGDQETYMWVDNTVTPSTGMYSTKSLFNFNGSITTVAVAGNTVLHAGNYTSYVAGLGGGNYTGTIQVTQSGTVDAFKSTNTSTTLTDETSLRFQKTMTPTGTVTTNYVGGIRWEAKNSNGGAYDMNRIWGTNVTSTSLDSGNYAIGELHLTTYKYIGGYAETSKLRISSGNMYWHSGATQRLQWTSSAMYGSDNAFDIGASAFRMANVYTYNLVFSDGTTQTTAAGAPATISAIGSVIFAWADTASNIFQGGTIAGSSLYSANTTSTMSGQFVVMQGTYGANTAFWAYRPFVSTSPLSYRISSGNTGYLTPAAGTAYSTYSGTWRLLTNSVAARSSYYDGYAGTTVSQMSLGMWVRIS